MNVLKFLTLKVLMILSLNPFYQAFLSLQIFNAMLTEKNFDLQLAFSKFKAKFYLPLWS